jgi:hypothetical protein
MGKGGGGGGSPQPTTQTVQQTNLPDYVRGDFERLLERAEAESKAAYSPYVGQRIATPGADVLASEAQVRQTAGQGIQGLPAAQLATAANIATGSQRHSRSASRSVWWFAPSSARRDGAGSTC